MTAASFVLPTVKIGERDAAYLASAGELFNDRECLI